ncbi:hypothetical protein EHS25_003695 [Saitozyma podzolica]|jgi:hypothetical protein|uniref:Uncharacterized protein n=1 Tax=Saitozyma podzolica TaxID=1890683 RepID=A0A427Y338_9TREE|nr:hypothetical protein EHS25_003695 [Saitozyma podzolica]
MDATTSASSSSTPLIESLLKEACEESTKTSTIQLISSKAIFGYNQNGKAYIMSWHRIDSSDAQSSGIVYDPSVIPDYIYGPLDPSLEASLARFIFSSPEIREPTREALSEAFFPEGQLLGEGEETCQSVGPIRVKTSRKREDDSDPVSVMTITFDGDVPGWPQRSPELQALSEGLNVYRAYERQKKAERDELMRAYYAGR